MTQDAARLFEALISNDSAAALRVLEESRASGLAQAELFDAVWVPAIARLGGAWASGEVDEVAFAQAAVVADQVAPFVVPPAEVPGTGIGVLLGCAEGDEHSLAKDMSAAALREVGYRVVDLGTGVRPADFLERVEDTAARIVLVFAETSSSARAVARVREVLSAAGHEHVVLLVGGGPFVAEPALARSVGANGVVRGAESSLKVVGTVVADLMKAEEPL